MTESIWYMPNMSKLVELHNQARSKNSWVWSLNPLGTNEDLMNYAQDWAITMSKRESLKHSNMRDISKLGFKTVGENIAYGQKNEESVMKTWLWSPGHRANIMKSSFNQIGCGFSYSDKNIIYWCVCFAGK